MDIELARVMNGVTAAKRIRASADIPVIIYLTAYSQTAQLEQARATSPYGYLIKPVAERELLATLEMALHRHALDRQLKDSEERLMLACGVPIWACGTGICRANTITCNGPGRTAGVRPGELQLSYCSGNNTFIPAICPPSRMRCARTWKNRALLPKRISFATKR
ncbi:MAG: response regulator [Candidatus Competibacteraceae bacterium]